MPDSDPNDETPQQQQRQQQQHALTPTPHDALFRRTFSQVEHARGELQHVLPALLVASLDWSTLRVESGSYVEDDLRAHFSDILFSIRNKTDRTEYLIYVLVEHQSTPDPLIVLRMLRYLVAAQFTLLQARDKSARKPGTSRTLRRPPVVLPVLVSNAKRAWPHPLDLHSLFPVELGRFPELAPHVPQMTVFIDDLRATTPTQLLARNLTDLAVLTLWFLRDGSSLKRLKKLISHYIHRLRRLHRDGPEHIPPLVQYLLQVTPPMQHEALYATLISEAPDMEAPITNAYDQLIANGRIQGIAIGKAEGKAEGEAKGKAEGEAKGKAELVLKLLTLKFTSLPDGTAERVNDATAAQLDEYAQRILSAATLEEVLDQR